MKKKLLTPFKVCTFSLLALSTITLTIFANSHSNNLNKQQVIATSTDINEILQSENKIKQELSNEEIYELSKLPYEDRLNILYSDKYNIIDKIKVFLGEEADNLGFIYYDLNTNEKASINEDMEFIAASTYKVGLNVIYYHLASTGKINLNDTIPYTYEDYEEGTGVLQDYDGYDLSIQDLLDLSIVYSDNIATNMLGRNLGGHANVRNQLYNLLDVEFDAESNTITPNIELEVLKYIYDNKNNPNFSHLIEVLTNTDFHDRLDKYLPYELVAHKVGTNEEYVHDVGLFLTDKPYILIMYTNDILDSEEKISQISNSIYLNNIN
ncbi:serine hydrolase [Clostridium sp.]|uniref:serine hydrolase n=1 Tax=Clostridium sp. TaxID=1506 RepID=UPI003F3BF702